MDKMTIDYIEGNPPPKLPSENLPWNIISVARKVIDKTAERVSYSRRTPVPNDIYDQLAIRSIYLNQNSVHKERNHILAFLARSLNVQKDFYAAGFNISLGYTITEEVDLPYWYVFASWKDIKALHEMVANSTRAELRRKGREIIAEVAAPLVPYYPLLCSGDVHFMATGVSDKIFSLNKRRPPKENWQTINRAELEKLLGGLGNGTEIEGYCSLFSSKRNIHGLTRLLARTIWLTGMRGIEVFSCKVMDHNTNEEVLSFLGSNYFTRSNFASEQKILASSVKNFNETMDEIVDSVHGGRDLRLHIWTAKIRNSSPKINNSVRVQKLEGINRDDLKSILIASCLRKLLLASAKTAKIRKSCTMLLGKTSLRVLPYRNEAITLHTLRHAFIDAARKSLPPEEVGTLSGHTSVKTMRGYGGKYARYSKSRKHNRWFPKPEKMALARTRHVWESRKSLRQKEELQNTDIWVIPTPEFE